MRERSAPPDFMAMEPLLIEQLRLTLPQHVHVLARKELAEITEATQPTPAVHVLYRGYRPRESQAAMYEELDLLWLTVVAVQNASTLATGEGVRTDAGPLMGGVVQALGPWVPDLPGYKSLHLDAAPPVGYRAGFGYFPIGWRVHVQMRVAPNSTRRIS